MSFARSSNILFVSIVWDTKYRIRNYVPETKQYYTSIRKNSSELKMGF